MFPQVHCAQAIVRKTWPYQFLISFRLQTPVQKLAQIWATTSQCVHSKFVNKGLGSMVKKSM